MRDIRCLNLEFFLMIIKRKIKLAKKLLLYTISEIYARILRSLKLKNDLKLNYGVLLAKTTI